jgi:hypothetical protein
VIINRLRYVLRATAPKKLIAFALCAGLLSMLMCGVCAAGAAKSWLLAQAPHVTIKATTATAFEDGSGDGVFVISRDGPTSQPLTVPLRISGTATNGVDYVTIRDEVQIPAGKSSVDVRVKPINDTEVEEDELVTIGLADVAIDSVSTNTLATVVIKDNDTVVRITALKPNGSENGPTPIVFQISRAGNLRSPLTVNYAVNDVREAATRQPSGNTLRQITDGTSNTILVGESSSSSSASEGAATSGVDFVALPGAITFNPGEDSKLLNIMPIDDTIPEGRESVTIRLLPSPLYTLVREAASRSIADGTSNTFLLGNSASSGSSATGFIEDNDQPTLSAGPQLPLVTISATQPNASEDGPPNTTLLITIGTVTVTRTGPFTQPLTVLYSINDATLNISNAATNGADFERLSGQVIIPAGASSTTITIKPIHDNETEPDEQVVLQLLTPNPQTYSLQKGSTQAAVTIKDHKKP